MASSIDHFLAEVSAPRDFQDVFNPWRDVDPMYDCSADCASWRLSHLRSYMEQRLATARMLLVAEAPGYQGCRFSGIAMTSERALLLAKESLVDNPYFDGPARRTSKEFKLRNSLNHHGMTEPTATVVWRAIGEYSLHPRSVVLWNSFAWHPHQPGHPLSNRAPTDQEIEVGLPVLEALLAAFPDRLVLAIGQKAQNTLRRLGVAAIGLRHPANGGVPEFRRQFAAAVKRSHGELDR